MGVVKQGAGPMGKTFAIHEEIAPGADMSTLAAMVGKNPAEAREELRRLIEQIPDDDLQNFIGAQVAVVT
jgi:hypothetical protein